MRHLVWFRNDLRTHDQPALVAACQSTQQEVLALYLLNPEADTQHDTADVRTDFDRRTLAQLQLALQQLGIPLLLRAVNGDLQIPGLLLELCRHYSISTVFFNREHGPDEQRRDQRVTDLLHQHAIKLQYYEEACIVAPGRVERETGQPYKVFTPFKKKWLTLLPTQAPLPAPHRRPASLVTADSLPPLNPQIAASLRQLWPAGELSAIQRLEDFCHGPLSEYDRTRDIPAAEATSQLSPYLANGSLSSRTALLHAQAATPGKGKDTWISELAWRDFFRHVLVAWPEVGKHRAFQPHTEALKWSDDPVRFERWCRGTTGFPIVDAAMRQLLATGWMHNRLRMVTAMFLVKDAWIDWRWGERWFMQHLIDGELAANNGNWQWCASTGVDAVPYFRIFNPWTQGQRFDPEGLFIKKWIPELRHCDARLLHQPPHPATARLHPEYPSPMLLHEQARIRTLASFKALGQRL